MTTSPVKISGLTPATGLSNSDVLPVSQGLYTTPVTNGVNAITIATYTSTIPRVVSVKNINSTSYSVTNTDFIILAANSTITLPASSSMPYLPIQVKNIGQTVTINTTGSDKIDGNSSLVISTLYSAVGLVSNASSWFIL